MPTLILRVCSSSETQQLGRALDSSVELPVWSPRASRDPTSVSQRALNSCPGSPGAGCGPASLTWWVCRTVRMMKSLAFL